MRVRPLRISGAWEITPTPHRDDRGVFLEAFRADLLAKATGRPLDVLQANVSVSARGVLRGIHVTDVPGGQAKYVTAVTGRLVDYVVDLRVGSPTFGEWDSVVLDAQERRAVFLAEGLGHAILALEDGTTAHYLCSSAYDPARDRAVNPLDPRIGLEVPTDLTLTVSPKDAAAPTLETAEAAGLLPAHDVCTRLYARLGARGNHA
jgi:dTDP-4-dehydrorhamnose 3,5-epimerase